MWWRRPAANDTPARAPAVPVPESADALLRRLEWTVLRRLDGLVQGEHRTFLRGGGLDLADLREYQPHDDVRHIDWNVTARLQQPHVRQYMEDRDLVAWFVLDLSPSVAFGSGERDKRAVLQAFVAVLARLLTRHGNRVGALLFGHGPVRVLPPQGGRSQVLQLLHATAQVGLSRPDEAPAETRLADWLQQAGAFMRRRAAVFVVSDFISAPGWERPLGLLAQRHDVLAVRLFDPLELELPDLGLLPLRDAETGERLWVDTHDRTFRERFARLAAEHEAALRMALVRAGVDALELSTGDDLTEVLLRLMAMRRRRPVRATGAHAPVAEQEVVA
jgi:uncharacterized protein (DUF58 family)